MSGISTKDINKLRALQASGLTTDEIVDRSGWTEDKLSKVREELFAREEMDLVGRRTEDVFIDYVMRTRANIRQLDDILEDLRMTKQGSAMVGAVKAKQDLMDRILNRGQEFGLIEKKPDRSQVGIVVANMDDLALREMLVNEMNQLRSMMDSMGGKKFLEVRDEDHGHRNLERAPKRMSSRKPTEPSILDEIPSDMVRKKSSPS